MEKSFADLLSAFSGFEDDTSSEDDIEEKLGDFLMMVYCSSDSEEVYPREDLAQTDNGQHQNRNGTMLSQENTVHQDEISPILEATLTMDIYKDEQETSDATLLQLIVGQEDCSSSGEEECGVNEGEIIEKPGDFLRMAHCSDEEAMGQALAQEHKTQVSNQDLSNSYDGSVPEYEHNWSEEEDQRQDTTKTTFFQVEYTLKYPEISYDSTEELTDDDDDDDDDDDLDEVENFSEEEHQEAGESFADYPSDFSSCEYTDNTTHVQERNVESQPNCTADDDLDTTEPKSTDKLESDGIFLDDEVMTLCFDEDNFVYSYAKDDIDEMANQDVCLKCHENQDNHSLETWSTDDFSKCSISEEVTKSFNPDNMDYSVWKLDTTAALKSENIDEMISNVHRDDRNGAKRRTETQKGQGQTTMSSSLGSVDDSFFFNESEVSEVTEEEQMEDDKEEKKREQQRIQAFYRFYDDKYGESGREERQIKVQFCTEALSQVIHYDTDSSDSDSLSSSLDEEEEEEEEEGEKVDEEETDLNLEIMFEACPSIGSADVDLSSQESQSVEDASQVDRDSQNAPDISEKEQERINKAMINRKDRCLSVLGMILSLFLVIVMGLVMFWWVTDTEDWPAFF